MKETDSKQLYELIQNDKLIQRYNKSVADLYAVGPYQLIIKKDGTTERVYSDFIKEAVAKVQSLIEHRKHQLSRSLEV